MTLQQHHHYHHRHHHHHCCSNMITTNDTATAPSLSSSSSSSPLLLKHDHHQWHCNSTITIIIVIIITTVAQTWSPPATLQQHHHYHHHHHCYGHSSSYQRYDVLQSSRRLKHDHHQWHCNSTITIMIFIITAMVTAAAISGTMYSSPLVGSNMITISDTATAPSLSSLVGNGSREVWSLARETVTRVLWREGFQKQTRKKALVLITKLWSLIRIVFHQGW